MTQQFARANLLWTCYGPPVFSNKWCW